MRMHLQMRSAAGERDFALKLINKYEGKKKTFFSIFFPNHEIFQKKKKLIGDAKRTIQFGASGREREKISDSNRKSVNRC